MHETSVKGTGHASQGLLAKLNSFLIVQYIFPFTLNLGKATTQHPFGQRPLEEMGDSSFAPPFFGLPPPLSREGLIISLLFLLAFYFVLFLIASVSVLVLFLPLPPPHYNLLPLELVLIKAAVTTACDLRAFHCEIVFQLI